ncbi:MAG TPA: ABC transporter permease [Halanaerobiales bacterium]|nr:ABC transporter permease [Halanaerobiales bacterium]
MIYETIKIAIQSLYSNKLRTLLSMLGIIIGVGAVIAVVSIASGSQAQITSNISSLGSNLINISPGIRRGGASGISRSSVDLFTLELGEQIEQNSPHVRRVIPNDSRSGLFIKGDNNYRASLVGTEEYYQVINKYYPRFGIFFSDYDVQNSTNVMVLGSDLVDELFPDSNPVGQSLKFNVNNQTQIYKVIGVMEEKGRGLTGDLNGQAYIPISTFMNKVSNSKYVSNFVAQSESSENADKALEEIEYLLDNYISEDENYNIFSQDQLLNTINDVTNTMRLMLSGIAGISLLVGGIGIMNIMLVSVTERTKEIGIRKALGAKKRDILFQFIIESLTLSSIGGIIGILFGGTAAYYISQVGGWPFIMSSGIVALAFSFSLVVGMFFGIYPAYRASKLDPVDALSYE